MRLDKIEEYVELPEGVQVEIGSNMIKVKGPKGELERGFRSPQIKYELKDDKVIFSASKPTKREKKLIFTFRAHLRNMVKGVVNAHKYHMKICSGHFPMSVAVANGQLTVKNFLGEKTPRVVTLKEGVDVKVDGDIIEIESMDIEKAGQTATDIEQSTRITNRDIRVFQDGLYIIKKPRNFEE